MPAPITSDPPSYARATSSRNALKTLLVAVLMTAWSAAVAQVAPIPERTVTTHSGADLPGGDISVIHDITLERCHGACLADDDCAAFTFDQRNGVCYLKNPASEPVVYPDAYSGVVNVKTEAELARAEQMVERLPFLFEFDFARAREQATAITERYPSQGFDEESWLDFAAQQEPEDAVYSTGAAVNASDSGRAWLQHARALFRLATATPNSRYELNLQGTTAALNAALRLPEVENADALALLARGLEATFRGSAALEALELADKIAPGISPTELARLRELFGFRVLSHDVDARTAAPRICIAFSEPLAAEVDYSQYVQRSPSSLAVEIDGRQLCIAGVSYGERYSLVLRSGLPSADGDVLQNDVPRDVYVRDRSPAIRFPGRAYVLPARGPRALPIETVNANDLELTLLRVSDRNLVTSIRDGTFLEDLGVWEGSRFESNLAERIWQGEARLEGTLNVATDSLLPLAAAGDLAPGVYVLRAAVTGADPYDVPPATQWFIVSDLGVTTLGGSDGLHVVVQRLSDGQPLSGARVGLVARSNRELGEATTDELGHVVFPAGLALGSGNAAPAMVVVETADDFSVLSLDAVEFDLSDRGVAGRESPGPLDVFIATDRGVYRPGETINLTILVRDAKAQAVTGMPLTVRLLRPDGVEYTSVVDTRGQAGGHVVALTLRGDVPRGPWRVETLIDTSAPPLASRTVLVEDFLPERIDVSLSLSGDGSLDSLTPQTLQVEASHLFGAPAAGMSVTGTISVYATNTLASWPGYSFGRLDQRVDTQMRPLAAGLVTDAQGRLEVPLQLDRLTLEARPYAVRILTTLLDGAARPVERQITRPLDPTSTVVGIKPTFDGALVENSEAEFDLVIVEPDGSAASGEVTWQVDRVETRYQWYSVGSRWYWEPVTQRHRVAEGTLDLQGAPASLSVPVAWGRYELRATYQDAASSSFSFTAGWVSADATRETPDLLAVSLDAEKYAPGDTALLRLVPEEPGVALVTVLSDRVIDLRLVEVSGETTIELPVTDEWGTGAYVTASLIRPSDGPEHLPARSLGLAHAAIEPGARVLEATLSAPAETRSGETLTVLLEVPGAAGTVNATVAAVDLGILNVTGFLTPDPAGHYFGQRRLGVAIRDLYGRLIDARQGAMGSVRSGGDADGDASTGPVPAEDLVSLFSGPVTLVDGRAEISFDMPSFDGKVRLMAVVWTAEAVGQTELDVLVRDPVVMQASLPRFLNPGDQSRLRLELTHASGATGTMSLEATGHGLAAAPATVELAQGGRVVLDLPLTPTDLGDHAYRLQVTTPDGEVILRELRLTVLHTDPEVARSTRVVLAPGGSFVFDEAVLAGFRPGTARASLAAGLGAALDVPGLIMRLAYYPYGCTEQIASSLQPLLLAPNAVAQLGIASAAESRAWLQDGVDRILTRQGRSGGFGMWSAGGFDLWLDAYATDVLLRAEAQGISVPAVALRQALDNLRNEVALAGSMHDGAASYAYAYYVLAKAGEAAIGDLRYYADELADRFDTPLSAAQLAAALAAYGERERSEAMFARAQQLALMNAQDDGWRDDYGTVLRDRAGLLALAVEAGSNVVDRARLAGLIAGSESPNYMSTQEAVWVLQAATALGSAAQGLEVNGASVNGDVLRLYDGVSTELRNAGSEEVPVTVTTFGVPVDPPAAAGVGYQITRSHYTPDGQVADLSAVRTGDRLVVVLEVTPQRGVPGGRLIIDDPLPAGFEIDNPNLLRAGDVRGLDWLTVYSFAESTQARSERFLAAVNWTSSGPLRLAYFVRAVAPGDYHYAAPLVEDMYRPVNRAIGETGRLTVRP